MIPKLREVIAASRKAARDFKRALEEVGEQLAQRNAHNRTQLRPIPVRGSSRQPGSPLADLQRRHLSTSVMKPAVFARVSRATVSQTSRAVMYRAQPFRTSFRPGCGSSLYSNFTQHNSRMFSTYGPNITVQAVHNLNQGIRALFLQAAQLQFHAAACAQHRCLLKPIYGDETTSSSKKAHTGCFVEFNLTSATEDESLISEECYLDDIAVSEIESFVARRAAHQKRVLDDIIRLKDCIGSPAGRRLTAANGDILMRFFFPNCEPVKLEQLLVDNSITTGMVHSCGNMVAAASYASLQSYVSCAPADTVGSSEIRNALSDSPGLTSDTGSWYIPEDSILSSELSEYFAHRVPTGA